MVKPDTDMNLKRPGIMLLIAGFCVFFGRGLIDWIPFIGSTLGWLCVLAGLVMMLGGIFLTFFKRKVR